MIVSDEYALSYYPNKNLIVIALPQTLLTTTDTISPICDRRTDIKESDLSCLLHMTKIIFKNAPKQEVDNG